MHWDSLGWFVVVPLAYLVGSFPTAYITGRLLINADIRELGDRNAGSANVFRTLGLRAGSLVCVIDALKGVLALLITKALMDGVLAEMAAGLAAVAGHNWPFYLGFRGGRGAATALGVLMTLVYPAGIIMGMVALGAVIIFRKSTTAIAMSFIPLPLVAWMTDASLGQVFYSILLPVVVGLSHFASVRKLTVESGAGGQEAITPTVERS
ncbi:MAG: glycerol-3-phosphate acyltransferase [SAR202 cluster bacterium]|nr:glycerol-3-phosphate acyltransferase [SAR202 cluster bacterium]